MTAPTPPPDELSTAELVGVIAAVIAAQEVAGVAADVPWEEAALALGIVKLGGTVLENIARAAIESLRREIGKEAAAKVLPLIDEAVVEAKTTGVKQLVDISRGTAPAAADDVADQEPADTPSPVVEDVRQNMELVEPEPVTPTDDDDAAPTPKEEAKAVKQAEDVALTISYTAKNLVAAQIGLFKTWHSKGDKRVRPKHVALDSVTVRAANAFPGGIRYPHDPLAPLDQTIGCRCRCVYKMGD